MVALKFFKVEALPDIGDALPNAVYIVKSATMAQAYTCYTDNTATTFFTAGPLVTTSIVNLATFPTVNLPTNSVAIVTLAGDISSNVYKLINDTAEESLPFIVRPLDYALFVPRIWVLQRTPPYIPGPFADDAAASAGDVPLEFPYHTAGGDVKVRLT